MTPVEQTISNWPGNYHVVCLQEDEVIGWWALRGNPKKKVPPLVFNRFPFIGSLTEESNQNYNEKTRFEILNQGTESAL